ncbi:MAG: FKBP-type peptidyl-prolyl cis-trans isomerase [Phycisphaerae bacterium]|nr:FKBP-type peptidyl-prolyl cis-trans isomerase [Phycisphaerae bacterium]
MRLPIALLSLALCLPAVAQDSATKPADQPVAAAQPPAPTPIPVPDGPVVKKQELEGGLILEDITLGTGYEVKTGDAVVALYHGMLKEGGKVFDSAFERGMPIAFPLSGVIEGWQKGVPGMKVGGVRKLTIPSKMGYGERGAGQDIPPNADLVFVVKIVDALQTEDVTVGEGEEIFGQFVAVTTHVIKDKDGHELAKVEKPYIWIPGEFPAIQYGLTGMKAGGKRRLVVPKELNENPVQALPNLPQNVPLIIEIDLSVLRNLSPRR